MDCNAMKTLQSCYPSESTYPDWRHAVKNNLKTIAYPVIIFQCEFPLTLASTMQITWDSSIAILSINVRKSITRVWIWKSQVTCVFLNELIDWKSWHGLSHSCCDKYLFPIEIMKKPNEVYNNNDSSCANFFKRSLNRITNRKEFREDLFQRRWIELWAISHAGPEFLEGLRDKFGDRDWATLQQKDRDNVIPYKSMTIVFINSVPGEWTY